MATNVTLFGIPNCNTVKKARTWLDEHHITYTFHDFKKQGLTEATIQQWLKDVSWETLVNKKGMTWRNLSDADKQKVTDTDSAIALMLEHTSVIKRPVLVQSNTSTVGFDETQYQQIFS